MLDVEKNREQINQRHIFLSFWCLCACMKDVSRTGTVTTPSFEFSFPHFET